MLFTHTFTYQYRAGESYEASYITGVASAVSQGSFPAADSQATFDRFGRRVAMNYDVASGATKKEEFSFDGDGNQLYSYGRAKAGVRPAIHNTWAGGQMLGTNFEDGGIHFKWGGQTYSVANAAGAGGIKGNQAATMIGRGIASPTGITSGIFKRMRADFTETYDVAGAKPNAKDKHLSEQQSAGVRYTRGLTGFQAGGSSYTVQVDDTLRGIAQKVYGNEGLWYLIADANGLNSDSDLAVGQTINVPETRVTGNDASTFRPFSPDALPVPQLHYKPPETNWFVAALAIVVAIVVTAFVSFAASTLLRGVMSAALPGVTGVAATAVVGATTMVGFGVGGMAGSVASQQVNVWGGNQDSIDWDQARVGGLTSMFTMGALEGISATSAGAGTFLQSGTFAAQATRGAVGAVSNMAANQIVTGHSGFQWSTMVAASLASGFSGTNEFDMSLGMTPGNWGEQFVRNLLNSGVNEAVLQSFGDGGHFDITSAFVGAFGSATGGVLAKRWDVKAKGEAYGRMAAHSLVDAFGNPQANIEARAKSTLDWFNKQELGLVAANATASLGGVGGALPPSIVPLVGVDDLVDNPQLLQALEALRMAEMSGEISSLKGAQIRGAGVSFGADGNFGIDVDGINSGLRDALLGPDKALLVRASNDISSLTASEIAQLKAALNGRFLAVGLLPNQIGADATALQQISALQGNDVGVSARMAAQASRLLDGNAISNSELVTRQALYWDLSHDGPADTRNVAVMASNGAIHTVDVDLQAGATLLAGKVGVSFGEALSKTDWNMYSAALTAAADTGVEQFTISGAWRPTDELFRGYYSTRTDGAFAAMTATGRAQSAADDVYNAGVRGAANKGTFVLQTDGHVMYQPETGDKRAPQMADIDWGKMHTTGQGLDIRAINNVALSGGTGLSTEFGTLVDSFSAALMAYGGGGVVNSVFQPWHLYGYLSTPVMMNNGADGVPKNHLDHLHFGWM